MDDLLTTIPANTDLGQHFLCDDAVLQDILAAANLQTSDAVLEIGPGPGVLTLALSRVVAHVLAIEKDSRFFDALAARLSKDAIDTVTLVSGDVLHQNLDSLLEQHSLTPSYHVVANLPYQITSRFFRQLFSLQHRPTSVTVLVQKEVAERATAAPGEMSMLSVLVQAHSHATMGRIVPPEAFCPPPAVHSAILHFDVHPSWQFTSPENDFFRIAKIGFSSRRKQLLNTLSSGLHAPKDSLAAQLQSVDLDPTRRAQTLTLAEWDRLAQLFPSSGV